MTPDEKVKREAHCWSSATDDEGRGYTCMLIDGHDGPHEFYANSEIKVQFKKEASE